MKYLKSIVINSFATLGAVNTLLYLKNLIDNYYENKKNDEISKKLQDLDRKIKYIDGINNRIENIDYTLSELKNIIGNDQYSSCEHSLNEYSLNKLKNSRDDFCDY
jgi:hypothetical protein